MATAQVTNSLVVNHIPLKLPNIAPVIPVKFALMGEQGTGKSTSAALILAGLSKQYHGGAPIHVTDPELSWQFLDPVIFAKEKIILVQRTVPTFKAMLSDLERAEKEGACAWGVELGKIWIEIVRTLQKTKPATWGMELRAMWDDFVAHFLNSKLHCVALGRIQDVVEQVIAENGNIQSVKVGEGMKAGGQANNFGYEPHLVIRMFREQRARVRKGKTFESEGRVIHRAEVTKDRTWALNGKVFRWPDRDGYEPGDFKYVWQSFAPHFLAVQKTMAFVKLDVNASSASMIDPEEGGEYFRERERKAAISAEIKACLDLSFGGRGKDDVQVRLAVTDLIFGVKSKEAADQLPVQRLERGLHILQAYERIGSHDMSSKETILVQIHDCILQYDCGESEDEELPF